MATTNDLELEQRIYASEDKGCKCFQCTPKNDAHAWGMLVHQAVSQTILALWDAARAPRNCAHTRSVGVAVFGIGVSFLVGSGLTRDVFMRLAGKVFEEHSKRAVAAHAANEAADIGHLSKGGAA